MTIGYVMLCHTALERAAEVARHWANHDCPVVIHVDRRVKRAAYNKLMKSLEDLSNIRFSGRHACEWGTWGIVAATQEASTIMLRDFPEVRHVFLPLALACLCGLSLNWSAILQSAHGPISSNL